jgi:hypothetical protein
MFRRIGAVGPLRTLLNKKESFYFNFFSKDRFYGYVKYRGYYVQDCLKQKGRFWEGSYCRILYTRYACIVMRREVLLPGEGGGSLNLR